MFEASKTQQVRGTGFSEKYLAGTVLDIGCGRDLVVSHAQPFDRQDGDANRITDFLKGTQYDCVHSSHCLEHMTNVPAALALWWSLVKPGGYLVLVVPHEDLYEQGIWPSIFNDDHKATFRLKTGRTWSPVSYDVNELVADLSGAEIVGIEVQDQSYDHKLQRHGITTMGRAVLRVSRARRRLMCRVHLDFSKLERLIERLEWRLGMPIDQTEGAALAQIQAVVRKSRNASIH